MITMSYSDSLYLQCLCDVLSRHIINGNDLSIPAASLRETAAKLQKKANGYWKLPEGKKWFLQALETIALLLEYGATPSSIKGVLLDFSQILGTVNHKCRVTFLLQDVFVWPSLQSVYEAMAVDSRFETRLVYVPFHHPNQKTADHNYAIYQDLGLPILRHDKYSLTADNPDVVFFAKPYDLIPPQFFISEVEKIIDKTVYIPYGIESDYHLIRYGFQQYTHYRAWRHIVYGDFIKQAGAKYGYRNGENIAVWGHPKFDYYLSGKKAEIPTQWRKKIRDRQVLCWCPHHTIVPGPECVSTWLENYPTVFAQMEKHHDLFLLWRPHPLLFGAIVKNGYMTQEQMDEFLTEKISSDNIILDQSPDYHAAFDVSDGMITDGTTFSVEYLCTGKPLMLTTKDVTQYYNSLRAKEGLYIGESPRDIIEFIENLSQEKDPKKKLRQAYAQESLFIPKNGTIGAYIADHILNDLMEDQYAAARRTLRGKG